MAVSQVQVLNRILADHSYGLIEANGLTVDFFPDYASEFTFIKNHHDKYGVVPDQLTFAEMFPTFEFVDVKEPTAFILEKLFEDNKAVYMGNTFNKIREFLESGDAASAASYFKKAYDEMPTNNVSTSIDLIEEAQNRLAEYKDKLVNRSKYYLSTGFHELDDVLGGIDRRNEIMIIAARPGQGKSWFLLAMAVASYMQGMRVGMYSGEMTKEKVGIRFDTLYGHINNAAVMHGRDYQGRDSKEYETYINNIREMHSADQVFINDKGLPSTFKVITPNEIMGKVTVDALAAFVERDQLDILFIDQYSLLDDDSGAKSEHEKVAAISKAVKRLQTHKLIPVIAVCQMNREKNEDNSKDVSQLGLSDRLGQDATTVLMLDREAKKQSDGTDDTESPDSKEKNILDVDIAKARDGGFGKFKYLIDLNRGKFYPLNASEENADRYGDDSTTF